jgi:hypothetical protein
MTFPQTGILDTFNRPDQVAPVGGYWTDSITSTDTPGFSISGNKFVIANFDYDYAEAYWNARTYTDCEVYCDAIFSDTEDYTELSFWLRTNSLNTSNISGYFIDFNRITSTIYQCFVKQVTDGLNSSIQLANYSFTHQDGDSYGASIIGTTMTVYQRSSAGGGGGGEWFVIGTVDDSAVTGPGYTGLALGGINASIDNFGGGPVGESPTPGFGRSQLLRRKGWV